MITKELKQQYEDHKSRRKIVLARPAVLSIKTDIDYGHRLPNHKGKCFYSHGHTAIIKLQVEGKIRDNGMVMDFKKVKKILHETVDQFDHTYLNDLIKEPTTERLAYFIWDLLEAKFNEKKITLKRLEISEGLGKSVILNNL